MVHCMVQGLERLRAHGENWSRSFVYGKALFLQYNANNSTPQRAIYANANSTPPNMDLLYRMVSK
jgi:hypothetical protein